MKSLQKNLFAFAVLISYTAVQAQSSGNQYKTLNEMILEGSIKATTLAKREIIEKQSNDAITSLTNNSALNKWKDVLAKDPDNANVNYKMGLCYFFPSTSN